MNDNDYSYNDYNNDKNLDNDNVKNKNVITITDLIYKNVLLRIVHWRVYLIMFILTWVQLWIIILLLSFWCSL